MSSLFLLLGRWSFCCWSQHLKGIEVVMAWRKWLTLFAWHEPVLACLFHQHQIFQTFYVRQARFTCQQANESKTFLLVGKQMLVLLCRLASFAMQIWLLTKLANKMTKLRIVILCWQFRQAFSISHDSVFHKPNLILSKAWSQNRLKHLSNFSNLQQTYTWTAKVKFECRPAYSWS